MYANCSPNAVIFWHTAIVGNLTDGVKSGLGTAPNAICTAISLQTRLRCYSNHYCGLCSNFHLSIKNIFPVGVFLGFFFSIVNDEANSLLHVRQKFLKRATLAKRTSHLNALSDVPFGLLVLKNSNCKFHKFISTSISTTPSHIKFCETKINFYFVAHKKIYNFAPTFDLLAQLV